MLNFTLHTPTRIVFGKGELARAGEIVKEFGSKALIVTGKSSARKQWMKPAELPEQRSVT